MSAESAAMSASIPDETTAANLAAAHERDGWPAHLRTVPFYNLGYVLSLHAKTAARRTFLTYIDEDGEKSSLTYGEFNARAHQVANMLHDDLGVRRGDRVAVIAHNHPHTVLIYMACWIIGAAVAPQNTAEDDERIAYILRNSEAVCCVVMAEYMERAERIIHGAEEAGLGAPQLRAVLQVGGEPDPRYPHFETLVQHLPNTYLGDGGRVKSADDVLRVDPDGATAHIDDEALLVYTSGTTGAPKGVVLTQYNLLVDAQGIAGAQAITGGQRMMCVLPIHHVNGIVVTLVTPLLVGASTVLNRRFSASRFWRSVIEEKVHIVSVVPTLLQFLLEQAREQEARGEGLFGPGIHRRGLAHFRHFICGAGTLAVALARDFEDTFGFTVLHGYGLSETTCYSCFLPIDLTWEQHQSWMLDHGYPSIGVPIAPNEMGIFSADGSGQRLGPGERGEICVRGHNVMQHYFKRPDANRETFRFGWFRSGDEGFYMEDVDGRPYFFITGRIKELINRGGVKFSPFDIEEALLAIPGVKVGLAVAFENVYYGEEVGAYIVREDDAAGRALTEAAVLEACRARLGFEKAPKAVVFGAEVPVTATGKYQRLKLRDLFAPWRETQFRATT